MGLRGGCEEMLGEEEEGGDSWGGRSLRRVELRWDGMEPCT
jgi:hypothetical protein